MMKLQDNQESETPHIMIADDDEASVSLLEQTMQLCGYKTTTVTHSNTILSIAKVIKPDLLLLDIMMPNIDGFEICSLLKADPQLSDITIIFVSAKECEKSKAKAFSLGGIDYITKPVQIQDLKARVDLHLKLKKAQWRQGKLLEEMQDLYHNAPCGYHSLDQNGTFIFMNDTELGWLGYSREEVISQLSVVDLILPEQIPIFHDAFSKLKEMGSISNIRCSLVRKDRSTFPVLLNATAIKDSAGRYLMSRTTIFDMTEHVRMETEKIKLQEQLFETEKLASLGRLATGIAYEINNPLTIVKGFAGSLARKLRLLSPVVPADDVDKIWGAIEGAITRISLITEGLITYARSGSGHIEVVDIHQLFIEVLPFIHQITRGDSIEIRHSFGANRPMVHGHPDKLRQVILHLVTNACDALQSRPEGRQIVIETSLAGKGVTIAFSDNGCGIPKANLGKIFEPFFTTKGSGRGVGLGLYISRAIIESFDGSIKASSHEGEGTSFNISLPLHSSLAS